MSAVLIICLPRNIRNSRALQIKCHLYSNMQLLGNETNKAVHSSLLLLNSQTKIKFDIILTLTMNESEMCQYFVLQPDS